MAPAELIRYLAIGRPDRGQNHKNNEILANFTNQKSQGTNHHYKESALKILKKSHKLEDGKRIRLTSEEDFEIHIICEQSDTATLIFIAVTDRNFEAHHSITTFFDDWNSLIVRSIPRSEWGASKLSISSRCETVLKTMYKKYRSSAIIEAQAKTDEVKHAMTENIDLALQTCESVEDMESKARVLEEKADAFHTKAVRVRCRLIEEHWMMVSTMITVGITIVVFCTIGLTGA